MTTTINTALRCFAASLLGTIMICVPPGVVVLALMVDLIGHVSATP